MHFEYLARPARGFVHPAQDPVVGRGGEVAALLRLPLKRELRGRVRRRRRLDEREREREMFG